ncbi:MAG: hypothetical protein ACK5VT_04425 [Alphaproteobacteria bacterium]|jgi:hypothetical protein
MAENAKISVEQIAKALKQLSEFEGAVEDFPQVGEGLKAGKEAYKTHKNLVETAKEYVDHDAIIQPHTELKEGKKILKADVTDSKIREAFDKFKAAEKKLEALPPEDAKHIEDLSSKLGGWFGEVHSQGGFSGKGLKGAIKNNFAWVEGNKKWAFGRGVAALCAVGLVGDGLFRSKTSDGEDRSLIVRGAEIGLFAAGAALALAAGKAKLSPLTGAAK